MKRFVVALFAVLIMATPALAEKTKVSFWHAMGGDRITLIKEMCDDFNKAHPDIEVTPEYKGSYRDTLNASILAFKQGKAPNIVHIFEVGSQLGVDAGIFMPFEDTIKPGDDAKLDDFVDGVANYYRIGGKFYSVPFNSSNPVLYYNKTLFKKAGLDPENPPKTFNEVIAASEKLKASGAAPYGITWPLHCWFVEQWMGNQGALLANNENGRAARATDILLDSEPMLKIMTWWKKMYDDKLFVYSGKVEDWDGANNLFISGQAAMLITSTSDITFMQKAAEENHFELGTGFLPVADGSENFGTIVGGASLWMTKGHSDKANDATKNFLLWFTNTANEVRWHKGTGYFPVRKSAVTELEKENWFEKNPAYAAAFKQLMATKPVRSTQGAMLGMFPELRNIVTDAVQSILNGADIKATMKDADARADKALERYNRSVK
ncbi:ABC transporter substrate-binding protein [Desulfovibrio subterraneus]|uniref:sn-glycerol-3-phosphate-binding periplasmic protein UgpB n=1 Tax=Desulfovibrio subterraneus TaxID=2718620 RepID=A0A7J0BGE0_9BACT|nr:ABC transporter substrate-binding protein [Desulfovibrio subterraneus]GFM32214.1 ABC transporter substrate-binding protein [Desulfovibrio subterraneus]